MPKRPVPRLFLIRHGQTEWSQNGRHTGRSDIPLTPKGEEIILSHNKQIVGDDKLIKPANLTHVLVSPRQRAQKTFHLLFSSLPSDCLPAYTTTEDVREWDYGDYEGLTSEQIREKAPKWDIWGDGCPGGESVQDITTRIDRVIAQVRGWHRDWYVEGKGGRDCMIVAHAHFLRSLVSRWVEFPIKLGTHFNIEPAGVTILTYNHSSLDEPALTALNLFANHDV